MGMEQIVNSRTNSSGVLGTPSRTTENLLTLGGWRIEIHDHLTQRILGI